MPLKEFFLRLSAKTVKCHRALVTRADKIFKNWSTASILQFSLPPSKETCKINGVDTFYEFFRL